MLNYVANTKWQQLPQHIIQLLTQMHKKWFLIANIKRITQLPKNSTININHFIKLVTTLKLIVYAGIKNTLFLKNP